MYVIYYSYEKYNETSRNSMHQFHWRKRFFNAETRSEKKKLWFGGTGDVYLLKMYYYISYLGGGRVVIFFLILCKVGVRVSRRCISFVFKHTSHIMPFLPCTPVTMAKGNTFHSFSVLKSTAPGHIHVRFVWNQSLLAMAERPWNIMLQICLKTTMIDRSGAFTTNDPLGRYP